VCEGDGTKSGRRGKRDGRNDTIKVRGFFRINITEDLPDGTENIVGDSGWYPNLITNQGKSKYICDALGHAGTSKYVSYVALGTGGAPAATDTTLSGEIMASTQRVAVTYANNGSTACQFLATFASANSFTSSTVNISNIGLFSTTTTSDTLMCGNTYASSSCATNQNCLITYSLSFS
jgi:hypothetical protein